MKMAEQFFFLAMVVSANASAAVYNKDVWRARDKGAEFGVTFRIVDDEGSPVVGARCGGWIYMEREKDHGRAYAEYADTNGYVRIAGKSSEWFSVVIRKEGYYRTMFDVKYPAHDVNPPIVDGKWQPYGETRTVVLKRIKNPSVMLPTKGENRRGYPDDGSWAGYDLERHDWVAPIGNGVCEDMKIRFVTQRFSDVDFARTMDVSFADIPHGGAYKMAADEFSEFKTVYSANTNAGYLSVYRYEFNHEGRRLVRDELAKDEYLVFRTRTTVNPDGSLKSAHYGVIMGNWKFFEPYGMGIGRTLFNPTPNDTNLEDAETARKSRLGYEQQLEFERRRKAGEK